LREKRAPARDRLIDGSFPAPHATARSEAVNHVFTATLAKRLSNGGPNLRA